MCARVLRIHVFLWLDFCFILQQIYDDAPTKVQMLLDTGKIELVLECKEHVDSDSMMMIAFIITLGEIM
jgi:hypothetical protein